MNAVRWVGLVVTAALSVGCAPQGYGGYGAPLAPPPYAAYPPMPAPSAYGGWPQPMLAPGSNGAIAAVAFAQSQIGRPYCWGGSGPRCFDCSGLTRAAWMAGGRVIPRTSEAQLASLMPIAPAEVQPGDILWRPGHVGLYVGQGWAIAATHTGDFVRYQRADHFARAVRP